MTLHRAVHGAVDAHGSASGMTGFRSRARAGRFAPTIAARRCAALASLVNLAPPDPVASVTYVSHGNVLVIVAGDALARARHARSDGSPRPACHAARASARARRRRALPPGPGGIESLQGYLGEFVATIADLRAPGAGRRCLRRKRSSTSSSISPPQPLFAMHQPPQGYFRAPADGAALERGARGAARGRRRVREAALLRLPREHLRAQPLEHHRLQRVHRDLLGTRRSASDGDHVKVDPHLCMGCGACSTVCPSGAMSYQFPRVADRGAQLKQLLVDVPPCRRRRRRASSSTTAPTAASCSRAAPPQGHGLPARVIPLEAWHVASDRPRPAAAGDRLRREPGRGAVRRLRGRASTSRALREQMAIGAVDPLRARLRRHALRA